MDNDSVDKSPEDRRSVPSYCWQRSVARSKLYDVDPARCDDFWVHAPRRCQDLQVGSKEVTDGEWHFVAGVYDEKNLTPYVDGEQFNPRGAAGKPATSNAPLIIGAQGPDGKNGPLRGTIDEVAVYNTALDEDEIAEVMEGLSKQFQAVNASEKLAVTWGYLKDSSR